MSIIVAILLVSSLFLFFIVTYKINHKIICEEGFEIKKCESCNKCCGKE